MTDLTCSCGKPTSGAWLCDACQTTLKWAMVNASAYYGDLDTIARKQSRYGSGAATKGSIGKSQPLPVDMRFVDATHTNDETTVYTEVGRATMALGNQLRWDTWNTIMVWCRTVMADQPQYVGPWCDDAGACGHGSCEQTRRRRWPGPTVPSMVNYLARQFAYVTRSEWSPKFLDELLNLEQRLKRMVDRPADRWYAGKCSALTLTGDTAECTAELYATTDRGTITCPACGTRHDTTERREILLSEAKDILVTATEAAGALIAWTDYDGSETKLVDRIRRWRDRNRLEVRDVTSLQGRDRHLYRLGDIQELLIEHAQREQQRRVGA